MAVKQISVIIENEEGSLTAITESLAEAGVDLRTLTLADTENFGIIRMIVGDTEAAVKVLEENGYAPRIKDMVGFAVSDVPGGLSHVLNTLSNNNINVEYMYAMTTRVAGRACAVIRVADWEKAEAILRNAGVQVLREEDV